MATTVTTLASTKNGSKPSRPAGPPEPISSRWRDPPRPAALLEAEESCARLKAACSKLDARATELRGRQGLLKAELEQALAEALETRPSRKHRRPSEIREDLAGAMEELASVDVQLDADREALLEARVDLEAMREEHAQHVHDVARRFQMKEFRALCLVLWRLDVTWRSLRDCERAAERLEDPSKRLRTLAHPSMAIGCLDRVNEPAWLYIDQLERTGFQAAREIAASTRATVEKEEQV